MRVSKGDPQLDDLVRSPTEYRGEYEQGQSQKEHGLATEEISKFSVDDQESCSA